MIKGGLGVNHSPGLGYSKPISDHFTQSLTPAKSCK